MSTTLRAALDETMSDWQQALPEPWRPVFRNVSLNSAGVPARWRHDPWVPIFPVFKHRETRKVFQAGGIRRTDQVNLVGVPYFAHTFRALLVPPDNVRVVIVGQDPYPDITDATGQSFEQGNLRGWVQDAHWVAGSLKPILMVAAAEHTGNSAYAQPKPSRYADPGWNLLVNRLATKKLKLAPPDKLFPAYQKQGVLWLNTTLSISLFRVPPDQDKPSYQTAHFGYWKPFVSRLFEHVVAREGKPVVFGLWGTWAKGFKNEIKAAAEKAGNAERVRFVEAGHPVTNAFLQRPRNVLADINAELAVLGARAVKWFPT